MSLLLQLLSACSRVPLLTAATDVVSARSKAGHLDFRVDLGTGQVLTTGCCTVKGMGGDVVTIVAAIYKR
jgi:hypothetical protein